MNKDIVTIQISRNTRRMLNALKGEHMDTKTYDELIEDLLMKRGN